MKYPTASLRFFGQNARKHGLLLLSSLLFAGLAHAEAPMNVDDAGTLDQGGMKVEGAWRKDDKQRGPELVFGYSPIENLELELSTAQDRDRSATPATRLKATGFGIKWVPIQNETGWSFGFKFDVGQTRVNERETPQQFTEREIALNALASFRHSGDHVLHLNLGSKRVKALGERNTLSTWGIGYELPLTQQLKLTAEVFGEEKTRPDKAIGLRYEIFDGFKVSGAVGRGNDRNFGQIGFAWEF
ncbi:MAG: hypothetical protein BWY57_01263 [Betaproteobacteria bacterium ADurb.Bin341]|nr:MAG: hypothetical protein BWY57_01263 [Betaproteobacteria bacterium ADurb.Bin341]